ncbi:MAG: class I SAM-dependent methyltransferase [Sphingopyxis sp.]
MKNALAKIDAVDLQAILARHLPMYRVKVPHYQATMLDSLLEIWQGHHESLLDIGGGTGVIAEAMARLFPVGSVRAIDLVDRFCADLSVQTSSYDGKSIPFETASFDAATINNVLHHVPIAERTSLLCQVRRVVKGPLYIKDHVRTGRLDNLRLTAMDAIGNIPFDGQVSANYLSQDDWQSLAEASGYRIGATACPRAYRGPIHAIIFPNRLETTMRFDPA